MKFLKRVAEWNARMKRPQLTEPGIPAEEIWKLRIKLLQEELDELRDKGYAAGNIVEVMDGLCDLQVVLNGAIAEAGLVSLFDAAMTEVCDSNDSKFMPDGSALLREGDNKILKGPDYYPPNIDVIFWERESRLRNNRPEMPLTKEEELIAAVESGEFEGPAGTLITCNCWEELKNLICLNPK